MLWTCIGKACVYSLHIAWQCLAKCLSVSPWLWVTISIDRLYQSIVVQNQQNTWKSINQLNFEAQFAFSIQSGCVHNHQSDCWKKSCEIVGICFGLRNVLYLCVNTRNNLTEGYAANGVAAAAYCVRQLKNLPHLQINT